MRQVPHCRNVEDRFTQKIEKPWFVALRRESFGDQRQLGDEAVIHQRVDNRKKHPRAVGGFHVHRHANAVGQSLDYDLKMRAAVVILAPEIDNRTS